jgi:hypothetical protein
MELDVPAIDSLAVVRAYRENYVNFYMLWDKATGVPDGVKLVTPAEQPIEELDLPVGLREAMAQFAAAHPKDPGLTPLKFMRVVDQKPVLVVEDERPLPEETDLVSFSHTVTTTSADAVSVVVDHLVATRNPAAAIAVEPRS